MMRTILVAIVTMVMTFVLGPVVMIAHLLRVPDGANAIYARCVRLWARSVNRAAGVRGRIHGEERLAAAPGAVVSANHVSWFDIFPLASVVPWCSFVAKSELRRIPV